MPNRTHWAPPPVPFTLEHVAPIGVTRALLRSAVDSGRVTRLARGVYVSTTAVPDDPADQHVQRALAHQVLRPDAIASHHTAALAWGLDLDDTVAAVSGRIRFTVAESPAARSVACEGLHIAVRALPAHHRATHPSGLILTSDARTAIDVAAESDLAGALVTLDSAARRELAALVGSSRLRRAYTDERLLAAARSRLVEAAGHAATQFTRGWLTHVVTLVDPRRETALESRSGGLFLAAGLPAPQLQVRIASSMGDLYPDFLWPDQRVIGEADGAVKYRGPEDLVREKRRQEVLEAMGFLVIRWMAEDLRRRPQALVQRIMAALESRGGWAQ